MASWVATGFKYQAMLGGTAIAGGTGVGSNHTVRLLLIQTPVGSTITSDMTTVNDLLSDATECTFTNYSRQTLTGVAIGPDLTNNRAELDFDNITWSSAGGATNNTVAAAVVYLGAAGVSDSTCTIISYHDFGDVTTDGNDLNLNVGTEGAVHLT